MCSSLYIRNSQNEAKWNRRTFLLAVTGMFLWIRVCPFVLSSFCLSVRKGFLDWPISFMKLSLVLEAYVLLCVTARFFLKSSFCPKNWENWPIIGCFGYIGLLENLVINFFYQTIWSTEKVHIICCILALIPYSEKFWFLWYVSKCMFQIAGFLIWLYLQNKVMEKPNFLHVDKDLWKLKKLVEKYWDGRGQK